MNIATTFLPFTNDTLQHEDHFADRTATNFSQLVCEVTRYSAVSLYYTRCKDTVEPNVMWENDWFMKWGKCRRKFVIIGPIYSHYLEPFSLILLTDAAKFADVTFLS